MINISIKVIKDSENIPQRIECTLKGFTPKIWLALFLNDTKLIRLQIDSNGEKIGSIEPIPEKYHIPLISLGGFGLSASKISKTGVIVGQSNVVEDTFGDGIKEFPNVGEWSLELRYD